MPTLLRDDLSAMDALLAAVPHLHSAPQVAQRILSLTGDAQFDVGEVVDCLRSDPALAARILRVVNSSQFGLTRKVDNLPQAVAHLGQRSLRLVTMTFSLVDGLTRGLGGRVYYDYWRRALTMAAVAARLSEGCEGVDHDAAYAGGLLAELGTLVLMQAKGDAYAGLYAKAAHGPELVEAERSAYGFGHPGLGARLLQRWEFPTALVHAAYHHHDARPRPRPMEAAVRAGAVLVDVFWTPHTPTLPAVRDWIKTHYGLDTDGFIDLALRCKQDVLLSAELFGVRLGGNVDCAGLLAKAQAQHADASLEAALALDSLLYLLDDENAAKK